MIACFGKRRRWFGLRSSERDGRHAGQLFSNLKWPLTWPSYVISDDTIGFALQRQSSEPVFALGCGVVRRLKRNGVLRSGWSRGLLVAAADGIEICSSFSRCWDACMQRQVKHRVRSTANCAPISSTTVRP